MEEVSGTPSPLEPTLSVAIADAENPFTFETLKANTELFVAACKLAHQDFDGEKWQKNESAQKFSIKKTQTETETFAPSYHNQFHIEATLGAVDAVKTAYEAGNDIFGIKDILDDINRKNPDAKLTAAELFQGLSIAFAGHDLGNITKPGSLIMNEPYNPNTKRLDISSIYSNRYEAEAKKLTEERSADITVKAIPTLTAGMNESKQNALTAFVRDAILKTVFEFGKVPDETDKLGLLIHSIDQIGSYCHLPINRGINRDLLVAGLLNELKVRNAVGEDGIPVEGFVDFVIKRSEALFRNNEQVIESIFNVFDPEKKHLSLRKPSTLPDTLKRNITAQNVDQYIEYFFSQSRQNSSAKTPPAKTYDAQ